ncbi:MAG: polysaccharide biosynthesis tyrosine autokinase [Rubrivivax sp.]|nr:polysaccharide biosynthesis tyrosine autokinase [Rubrivivax sp.]
MAKFRDSTQPSVLDAAPLAPPSGGPGTVPPAVEHESAGDAANQRAIGDYLADLRDLKPEQVERILQHQVQHGVRFGEAAVALGMASKEDVLFALAQQFRYPYAAEDDRRLGPELVTLNEPFGARSEHFRTLRSQLMMRVFAEGQTRHALALVSPDTGDGRTYCASNLAVALAQLGGRTLLVDADLRNPRIHDIFKLGNRTGLSGILSGRSDHKAIHQVAAVPSLFVLPAGTTPPNPLELVERPAFGMLMRELATKFDHVVVDTPAAMHGADASVIAARCAAAVIIARKDRSHFVTLQELVASFSGSSARLAGVVLNEY